MSSHCKKENATDSVLLHCPKLVLTLVLIALALKCWGVFGAAGQIAWFFMVVVSGMVFMSCNQWSARMTTVLYVVATGAALAGAVGVFAQ